MSLTREQFLSHRPNLLEHKIQSWDSTIFIRPLSVSELNEWKQRSDANPSANNNIWLLTKLLSDDQGNPLFSEADIEAIDKTDFNILAELLDAGLKHNKLGTIAHEEQKKSS